MLVRPNYVAPGLLVGMAWLSRIHTDLCGEWDRERKVGGNEGNAESLQLRI